MYIFLKQYWKSIVCLILIFYVSLLRSPSLLSLPNIAHLDKVAHFAMYAVLAAVLYIDFTRKKQTVSTVILLLVVVLFPCFIGGLIEILQHYLPPRTADWVDFAANIVGVLLGFCAMYFISRRKK